MPSYSRIGKIIFIAYVSALALFVLGMAIATMHPLAALSLTHFPR